MKKYLILILLFISTNLFSYTLYHTEVISGSNSTSYGSESTCNSYRNDKVSSNPCPTATFDQSCSSSSAYPPTPPSSCSGAYARGFTEYGQCYGSGSTWRYQILNHKSWWTDCSTASVDNPIVSPNDGNQVEGYPSGCIYDSSKPDGFVCYDVPENGSIDSNGNVVCNDGFVYNDFSSSCRGDNSNQNPDGSFCGSESNAFNIVGNECKVFNQVDSYTANPDSNGCYNEVSWSCGDNVGMAVITRELPTTDTDTNAYYYDNSNKSDYTSNYDSITDTTTITYSDGSTISFKGKYYNNTDVTNTTSSTSINNQTGGTTTTNSDGSTTSTSMGTSGGTSVTTGQSGTAGTGNESATDGDLNAIVDVLKDIRGNQTGDNTAINENLQDSFKELTNINTATQNVNNSVKDGNSLLTDVKGLLKDIEDNTRSRSVGTTTSTEGSIVDVFQDTTAAEIDNPLADIENTFDTFTNLWNNFYDSVSTKLTDLETLYNTQKTNLENKTLDFTLSNTVTTCSTNYSLDLSSIIGKTISLEFDFCEWTSKLYNIIYPLTFLLLSFYFTLFNFKLLRGLV